ncbi:uncharacterized protein [Macrobrachium rosenbergii]|uniref:uncharacterized protein n=1 Tax=Macrobrachium rosenbergii TaxID=79674 RepID=UPI0034D643CF
MRTAILLFLHVAMATASSNSETSLSEQKNIQVGKSSEERLIYLPITDVLSYGQVVKLGFLIVLITVLWSLWYKKFGTKGPTFDASYFFPVRRFYNRNGNSDSWTDDWYGWVPVLNDLVDGIDKYRNIYQLASNSH